MSSSLFGVLTWLGHKETFVENGRRSDDWNLDEHGFCLLEAGESLKVLTWETERKKHGI